MSAAMMTRFAPGVLIVMLPLLSCEGTAVPAYSLVKINCSDRVLSDVLVKYGLLIDRPGILIPFKEDTQGLVNEPIPESIEVSWRVPNGSLLEKLVGVRAVLPADFKNDDLVLEICPDDSVRVKFRRGSSVTAYPANSWNDRINSSCECVPSLESTDESGPNKDK
jgi:hypothetical protein